MFFMRHNEFIEVKHITQLYKMEKDESGIYKHTGETKSVRVNRRVLKKDILNVKQKEENHEER